MRHPRTYLATGGALGLLLLALVLTAGPEAELAPPEADAATIQEPACTPSAMPVEGRASPYDSASVRLGETVVKVCYGRPSARGRTMIGGEDVPFGELWRTGANEPTVLHTTGPLRFAGIDLEEGSYAFYTKPGAEEWDFFVTRSTTHWGIQITEEVRAQEVGSVTLPRERPEDHVETFTIRFGSPAGGSVPMILEWEEFRVTVPLESAGG